MQRLNLGIREAEFLEHLVGMLALRGRRGGDLRRRARQLERLRYEQLLAAVRLVAGNRRAEVFHLLIGEDLVNGIDRSARHTGAVEYLDPFGAGLVHRALADLSVHRHAVLRAQQAGLYFIAVDQLWRFDRLAGALPHHLAGGGNVDVAVLGLEHAGRDTGRMIVAGLLGDLVHLQPARGLEVQHEDLRLKERGGDPLAFAGHLALQQRGEDPHGAEEAGGQVGDRDANAHGPLTRQAGDRHQPAHALGDLVEAGAVAVGAVLAEAGDRAGQKPLVVLLRALVGDPKPVFHVRAEVFDHDIGLRDHAPEGGEPLWRLQVKRDAPLVAVQVLEIGILARAAGAFAFFEMRGRLDLDDIGAPVSELADAGRAGTDAGEIEDGKTGKGLGSPGKRHRKHSGLRKTELAGANIPRSQAGCLHGAAQNVAKLQSGIKYLLPQVFLSQVPAAP